MVVVCKQMLDQDCFDALGLNLPLEEFQKAGVMLMFVQELAKFVLVGHGLYIALNHGKLVLLIPGIAVECALYFLRSRTERVGCQGVVHNVI